MQHPQQSRLRNVYISIKGELEKLLVGYGETIDFMLAGLFAGGHILIEGAPGLGKTLLVRALGAALGLQFSRIQFTPDLMPADITGTHILIEEGKGDRSFQFQPGPLFANLILADEINRATPKTQSALLEAMQEQAVTVTGHRYPLSPPFFVMATQNPIEMEGTYPLPEAQIDRFLMKLFVALPSQEEMEEILRRTTGETDPQISRVVDGAEDLLEVQRFIRQIPIANEVSSYIARLVRATHPAGEATYRETKSPPRKEASVRSEGDPDGLPPRRGARDQGGDNRKGVAQAVPVPTGIARFVRYGASPRAAQSLVLTAKARAFMQGRFNVSIEDIALLAYPVLRHRLIRNFEGEAEGVSPDTLITELLETIPRPAPSAPILAEAP